MNVCLLCLFVLCRYWPLRWADHPSRGTLPSACLTVCEQPFTPTTARKKEVRLQRNSVRISVFANRHWLYTQPKSRLITFIKNCLYTAATWSDHESSEYRSLVLTNTEKCIYKVVQIWPGQTVTCLHTNSPGHIWTALYFLNYTKYPLKQYHRIVGRARGDVRKNTVYSI